MATQNRTWQRKVLDAARRDGYDGLFWYIEACLPGRIHLSAAHPSVWVPVVRVAPDPEETRHWAHLLAELFRASNPPTVSYEAALTHTEALELVPWYEFGDTVMVDAICRGCGSVDVVDCELLAMSPAWLCAVCASREV